MPESDTRRLAGWFAGPKAENGEWFADMLQRIVQDYHAWRRNYFPEDGVIVDSAVRRHSEDFRDSFEDRLMELLGRLKADFPFQSPRYAGHMLAEQTLPAIAGYFAAMLYNPNNVSADSAPVTVRLELEACRLIARMLGHTDSGWAHLTSGGTIANIEALWVARTVLYLPAVVRDMRASLGLPPLPSLSAQPSPDASLQALAETFALAGPARGAEAIGAYRASAFNVVEHGLAAVLRRGGAEPVLLLPESHHYCFEKALDVLGLGRRAIVPVRVDADFRMVPDDLERALDLVASQGRQVLAAVAVVGSTEEGAVDPVDQVVTLRARREASGQGSFWLHADGAYGGYLRTMLVPERAGLGDPTTTVRVAGVTRDLPLSLPTRGTCDALEALGGCDSITIDPHKLGYVPYPAGAVSFRNNLVKPVTRQEAPYLDEPAGDVEAERRSDSVGLYILEGSKPGAAAAAVWLSHTLIPLDASGHGLLIRETVRHAAELHALLTTYPTLTPTPPSVRAECLCVPGSNIVCYAFRPARACTLAEVNAMTRRVYERFTVPGGSRVYNQRFFVSRTTLSTAQYAPATVGGFLGRLGVTEAEYTREGVFLLRSVLMNPWYSLAKQRGRYYLSELVEDLYAAAGA